MEMHLLVFHTCIGHDGPGNLNRFGAKGPHLCREQAKKALMILPLLKGVYKSSLC